MKLASAVCGSSIIHLTNIYKRALSTPPHLSRGRPHVHVPSHTSHVFQQAEADWCG